MEWVEDRGYINADDILNQEENPFNKDSITRGFILGALSKEDLTATELESLALEKGNISLKSYNITKATLRKEGKIDCYQKGKNILDFNRKRRCEIMKNSKIEELKKNKNKMIIELLEELIEKLKNDDLRIKVYPLLNFIKNIKMYLLIQIKPYNG